MLKVADEEGVVHSNPKKQICFSDLPSWLIFVGGCIVGSFLVHKTNRWRHRARRGQYEDVEDASDTVSEPNSSALDSDANTQEILIRYESIGIDAYHLEEQVEEEMNMRSFEMYSP